MSKSYKDEQLVSASWVLTEALGASSGATVLVVHDEATADVAGAIKAAGADSRIEVRCLEVSARVQLALERAKQATLDEEVRDEIDKCSRVVVLQSPNAASAHFRFQILEYSSRFRGKRAASMPGVSLQYLPMCIGDLDELQRRCALLAHRLVWGSKIVISTEVDDELNVQIGDYTPRLSTGRVPLGNWCNVPSGETFIVPNLAKSNGTFCVDGSVLGYPLASSEFVRLTVRDGKVLFPIEVHGSAELEKAISQLLFDEDGAERENNCTVVSEIGIGLNPHITQFTGLPIFDEKILGTSHVGLGNSEQFGGPTFSPMHNDYVIRAPKLWIDGDLALDSGRLTLSEDSVFPNWSVIPFSKFEEATRIERTELRWREVRKDGRIQAHRLWTTERSEGQMELTRIGDEETASYATIILWTMENTRPDCIRELRQQLFERIPQDSILPIVALLVRFGLVRVIEK